MLSIKGEYRKLMDNEGIIEILKSAVAGEVVGGGEIRLNLL